MRIADYIVPRGCIILPGAREPRQVFHTLFSPSATGKRRLFGASKRQEGQESAWEPGEEVFDALCASLKTTDLGNGVALPHVRLDTLPSPRLYVVSLPDGLPGRDADSPRLRLLFVFLTPTGQTDIHLQLLAHLGWLAGLEGLLDSTAVCREPDELVSALLKVEASGQGGFISLDRNAVFEELKTASGGLSTEEARRRIEITGPNLIRRGPEGLRPS